ncbi:C-type lectin domain family 2 member E-like isoform X2 [Meriones unguiculatus]|uniref:C-type lectin domain family 2 member E-like isoform X2 n=1 Tax=Meriones unguiculatus TaxID=10047 RepID=UPI00293E98F8|nr:C-type lectin domain family 2 member E-like isoform X2 [Meriones unguiculatus]
MGAAKTEETSIGMLKTEPATPDCLQKIDMGKKLQGKCLRIVSPESPAKLYCCYAVITVLTVAVIVLSVALSVRRNNWAVESGEPCYATCRSGWIGFGSKCFYFSEDMRNWTFSQTFCMALEAHLALYDSQEELNFLKRYTGASDHWIGLHRDSSEHPWRWTDNPEYNNLILSGGGGGGEGIYLNDSRISSSKDNIPRKWICSKSNSCTSQCPEILNPG